MHSPSTRPLFFFLLLLGALLLTCFPAHAQNELVPNPAAVKLRRVWTHEGKDGIEYEYGYAVSGVPDISGDSINDFAVYRQGNWLFYKGGDPPDTAVFLQMGNDSANLPPYTLLVGDFRGDGVQSIGLVKYAWNQSEHNSQLLNRPMLYSIGSDSVATAPWMVGEYTCFLDLQAANLDGALGDELIVMRGCSVKEVLIYKGGEDFTLSTPTAIISDVGPGGNNSPDNWQVYFADFDGDGRQDMVMGGSYPTGGPMLRFYWGDENSPWSWATRPPDRDLQLIHGQIGINSILGMGIYDLNGDGAADIGSYEYADVSGSRIYLSGNGKNARTRSFAVDDADYYVHGSVVSSVSSGYLNDSTRTYQGVGFGGRHKGNSADLEVSGSSYGPDHDYEAWFSWQEEGFIEPISAQMVAVDVTGDGYDDQIHSDYRYGSIVNTGIALILAGGPYIPFDDTTLTVQDVPVAGDAGGLYLWPNPVSDQLNIAWKGNLKSMPTRFALYDIDGRQVVEGEVQPQLGAALWRCASVAAGTYVLVAFDAEGRRIASATVVKQ